MQAADRDASVTGFLLHPAVLDSCLQLGAVVPEEAAPDAGPGGSVGGAFVPAGLAIYAVHCPLAQGGTALAHVRRGAGLAARQAAGATYRDHALLAGTGTVLAVLDGLEARQLHGSGGSKPAAAAAAAQSEQLLYEVAWVAAELAPAGNAAAAGLVALPDATAISLCTVPALAASGTALAVLQGTLAQGLAAVQLHAVQGVHAADVGGAQPAGNPSNAMWGMLRAFAQEAPAVSYGGLRRDAASAHQHPPGTTTIHLSRERTGAPSDGYGTALQGGSALRAVLLPSARVHPAKAPYHLVPRPRGAFSSLEAEPVPVGTAPPGWVEVQVKAVGINFR